MDHQIHEPITHVISHCTDHPNFEEELDGKCSALQSNVHSDVYVQYKCIKS